MQTVQLADGTAVPALGQGTWKMGEDPRAPPAEVAALRAAQDLGLTLVDFAVASRDAPSREQVGAAAEMFGQIAYPALMHCKSGADRAGLMSVLYAHFHLGQPLRDAVRGQLSLRTLHIRHGKTGVLDYMFERYFSDGEPKGLSLLEWVNSPAYDHDQIRRDFDAGVIGSLITETLLRRE